MKGHKGLTNSQTGIICFGSSSAGSNTITVLFQVMGVSYIRNKEGCPLYVKLRHWHRPVFVWRLRLVNETRHSAVACDTGVKETSSSQLPAAWMKKAIKVLKKKTNTTRGKYLFF